MSGIGKKVKACIADPAIVARGYRYLKKNGIAGFTRKVNSKLGIDNGSVTDVSDISKRQFSGDILFSIVMPVYNVELRWLKKAIASIEKQIYINWELCIADDCSTDERVREYLYTLTDERIKLICLEKNGGISYASNKAAELATGDYILLMDNDDVLSVDALYQCAIAATTYASDIIYSDQDIINVRDVRKVPTCKPDWSKNLILSQMYLGHLLGFKRELYMRVGGFDEAMSGSQDYDLFLRMLEITEDVYHIPKLLYSWRALPSSTAVNPDSKPYAQIAGLKAVNAYLSRRYSEGYAKAYETENLYVYDVRYNMPNVKVSIIIPTKDHVDLLSQAIDSIEEISSYDNYEIIILDNNSVEEETFLYFKEVVNTYNNVIVETAAYEFNWSKLNNQGMTRASGEVYIFLNNDVKIISNDWIERLASNALREDVGVVGGLLLFPDNTIQHAGVVIGIGGYADHIYKGMEPIHRGSPFISPMVTRDVTAVTGACMAISKATIEAIGGFDENFIICGSDVELCIRAIARGYSNIYIPYVKLYHYESKTRDSYIPEIDYRLSDIAYYPYRLQGDPFYNPQMDLREANPIIQREPNSYDFITNNSLYEICEAKKEKKGEYMNPLDYEIEEIIPYSFREDKVCTRKRLNLVVPTINPDHVFGGVSTALNFYNRLADQLGYDTRIIVEFEEPSRESIKLYKDKYKFISSKLDSSEAHTIVPYVIRKEETLPVCDKDYFVFTAWWGAYLVQEAYGAFIEETGIEPNKFIYLIQDYEPGFYPWSSKYILADSTYRCIYPQIGVFNSSILKDFFLNKAYEFADIFSFEPVFNQSLKQELLALPDRINKKKQILVYGRPRVARNAFEVVVATLNKLIDNMENPSEWTLYSAGEEHLPVKLHKNMELIALGKLSLSEYAKVLSESYAGLSLMVSPHPSYPPLEMAAYGIRVVTNGYDNKDLKGFSDFLTSVKAPSPKTLSEALLNICSSYTPEVALVKTGNEYLDTTDAFSIVKDIAEVL